MWPLIIYMAALIVGLIGYMVWEAERRRSRRVRGEPVDGPEPACAHIEIRRQGGGMLLVGFVVLLGALAIGYFMVTEAWILEHEFLAGSLYVGLLLSGVTALALLLDGLRCVRYLGVCTPECPTTPPAAAAARVYRPWADGERNR